LQVMPEDSLATLLENRRQFLGFVQRRVTDAALAEDILQAAYIRALKQQEPVKGESVVRWFYSVLRNAVIDHYRHRASESRALEQWGRELETAVDPSAEDENEVCACLMKVLDGLTPNYADILRAVELGEQPLTDFARQHNLSATNAGVRVHRARAALRKQLLRCCGACAEHACVDCTCRAEQVSTAPLKGTTETTGNL
jgi:RNA polymerase sigma factor (sigma-70 family)